MQCGQQCDGLRHEKKWPEGSGLVKSRWICAGCTSSSICPFTSNGPLLCAFISKQSQLNSSFSSIRNAFSQSECPTVSKFIISFAFRDILGWDQRIELVQRARSIAAKNSLALGLAVSVWEENNMFVDQMLSLHSVAIQSGLVCDVYIFIHCIPLS